MARRFSKEVLLLKYHISNSAFSDQHGEQWAAVRAYNNNGCAKYNLMQKDIEKETAEKFEKRYNLVLVHKDRDGEVWDTEDRIFQKNWRGRVELQDE